MKTLIITYSLLLAIHGTGLANQWFTIEGKRVPVVESKRMDDGTIYIRIAENSTISSANNSYEIYKKSDSYLRSIYPVIKKELYHDRDYFSYELFLKSKYAYDVVINAKYDSIIYFTSNSKTVINGYSIPSRVDVTLVPDTLAYVLNNERAVKGFSLLKLVKDRRFIFDKKRYVTPHLVNEVKVTTDSIQGIMDEIPIKQYGCYWNNALSPSFYGIVLDKEGNLLSGRLSAGKIYGFKTPAVYFFSPFIKTDGIGKLTKIIKDNSDTDSYYNVPSTQSMIQAPIIWNGIMLNKGDQFTIYKPTNATPVDDASITYTIIPAKPARINVFNNNYTYLVRNSIIFHGNFMPASFTLADEAMLSINDNNILMKAGTQLHFFRNGQFKSGIFIGSYKYNYEGNSLKLYSDISFHKNKKLKEGILAEDATVKIWGKEVTIPKDSVLRFTKKGKLETYTYVGDDNRIRIIFVPDIEK